MASDELRELQELLRLKREQIKAEKDLNKLKSLQREEASYESSIKKLKRTLDAMNDVQRKQEEIRDGFNKFGQAIANLPLGEYLNFSTDISRLNAELGNLQGRQAEINSLIEQMQKSMSGQKFKLPKPENKELAKVVKEMNSDIAGMGDAFKAALANKGDFTEFFNTYGDEGRKAALQTLDKKKGIVGAMKSYFEKEGQAQKDLRDTGKEIDKINQKSKDFMKVTLDTSKLWLGIRQNMLQNFGLGRIIDQVTEFDNRLANLKKEFQIPANGFFAASQAMADLTVKGAKFGLSTQESFEMVKTIGDEMKSSNVKNLSEIAQSVAAVPAAMGIASSEVAKITGQMMFFSQNADKVQTAFKSIGKQSAIFGQNSTKVAKQFGDAYPKFKMMGMKGNESAIAAMAAQAEKLGINLADSVQSSKDFLDIGQAMESAADLSLLGGAAAQVSYADLMQARLDPKKMIEIQDKVTAGLGKFNKATGEVDFGYADLMQLQKLAESLGVKQEDLMKRAKGQREDAAKAAMFDQNMFKGLSPEEKEFLLSKVVSKGGGKFGLEGFDGIKDLKSLSSDQVKAQMSAAVQDKKSLEEQAKERASFEETVNRMKGTIMALFNRLQPFLQMMTNVLNKVIDVAQKFSNAISAIFGPTVGRYVKAGLALGAVLMLTMGPSAIGKLGRIFGALNPLKLGKLFGGGGASKVGSLTSKTADIGKSGSEIGKIDTKTGGGGGFLSKLGSPARILAIAAAIVALGLAFLMIGKGIQLAASGMATFVNSFKGLNPAQLSAVKSALLGLGIGITAIIGVLAALAFSGAGLAAAGIMLAFGASVMMVGAGVFLTAKGLAALATAVGSLGKNVGGLIKGSIGLIALAGALVLISPALVVFGLASLVAVPGMFALGFLLKGLGAAKGVNPGVIKAVASSMSSMAWGLIALSAAAVVAPLAMLSAMALNHVATSINSLKGIDAKKALSIGSTLVTFANSVSKGLGRLAWMGLGAPLALVAAVSINKIAKNLNQIAPIDEKRISAFGKSLGSIGFRIAWGLTKLAAVGVPALLAIPGAMALNKISRLLNGVKPIDEKNMAAFSKSLSYVGLGMIARLNALSVVGAVGLIALPGALVLNLISRTLNGIKPIDGKNMEAFSKSLGQVSVGMTWGLIKLSLLSLVALPALPAALMLNQISRSLAGVKPVDQKNIAAFSDSLGQIGPNVVLGLSRLADIAVPSLIAGITASRIAAISKSLNNVAPVDQSKIASLNDSLGNVGPTMANGMSNLALMTLPALFASIAAGKIAQISKSLNSIVPVNVAVIKNFASAMGSMSMRMAWGMTKLAGMSLLTGRANKAASTMGQISKNLNSIVPVNIAKIKQLSQAMGGVGKGGLVKLAALSLFANRANTTARRLFSISLSLMMIRPVNKKNIETLNEAMGSVGKIALITFAGLSGLAKSGLATASRLRLLALNLSRMRTVNPAKIMFLNATLSLAATTQKGLKTMSDMYQTANKAFFSALSLVGISRALSQVRTPNIPAMAAFSNALSLVSAKVMNGIRNLSSIRATAGSAFFASAFLLGISRNLSLVKEPNIGAMAKFGASLAIISGKVMWGVTKLSLISGRLEGANKSAMLMASTSRYLSQVKAPAIGPIAMFGASLGLITGKVMVGVVKLGMLSGRLEAANKSAFMMLSTSRHLSRVTAPAMGPIAAFGRALGQISGRVMWGVTKLSLISGRLAEANTAAFHLANTSKNLGAVKAPDEKPLAQFGVALGRISKNMMYGVVKLAALAIPLAIANNAARQMVSLSNTLVAGSTRLIVAARTINLVPVVRTAPLMRLGTVLSSAMPRVLNGIRLLAASIVYTRPAALAATGLKNVATSIRAIPQVFFLAIRSVGLVLSSQMTRVSAGLRRLVSVIPLIPSSILASRGLAAVSRSLKAIAPINAKAIMDLAKVVNSGGSMFLKGFMKWTFMTPFIVPARRAISAVAKIYSSLNSVGNINAGKILASIPVVNRLSGSLTTFAGLGVIAPLIVSASVAVRILGNALASAAKGLLMFASVPWEMMSSAGKGLNDVVGSLNSVAGKVSISPSLSNLTRTLYALGSAMRSVSTGFASTTRAMAEFNAQSERMKLNTGKAEITSNASAARAVAEKGVAAGTRKPVQVFAPTAQASTDNIRVAPIEINLKLNGMQIQKLIAEANFYRT